MSAVKKNHRKVNKHHSKVKKYITPVDMVDDLLDRTKMQPTIEKKIVALLNVVKIDINPKRVAIAMEICSYCQLAKKRGGSNYQKSVVVKQRVYTLRKYLAWKQKPFFKTHMLNVVVDEVRVNTFEWFTRNRKIAPFNTIPDGLKQCPRCFRIMLKNENSFHRSGTSKKGTMLYKTPCRICRSSLNRERRKKKK